MSTEQKEVYYIPDIAKILGKSEAAIHMGISRKVTWLPPPGRVGTKLAWDRKEFDAFRIKQTTNTTTTESN